MLSALSSTKKPIIAITKGSPTHVAHLAKTAQAWSTLAEQKNTWASIPYPLTEQELVGDVITPASNAMHKLLSNQPNTNFIISEEAVLAGLPDKEAYNKNTLHLSTGEKMAISDVVKKIIANGYRRHTTSTNEPGTITVKGDTISIKHPIWEEVVHVHFFGNYIEKIITQKNQRSTVIKHISVPPLVLGSPSKTTNNITQGAIVIAPHKDTTNPTYTYEDLSPSTILPIATNSEPIANTLVLLENEDHVKNHPDYKNKEHILFQKHPLLAKEKLNLNIEDIAVISEQDIFPSREHRYASPVSFERAQELLGELTENKPAVHADHGIGVYEGLTTKTIDDVTHEYLTLRYSAGDAVYVPVEFAHKVSPYIGEKTPKIHRLNTGTWQTTKRKAKADAIAFAKELLAIAKKREGHLRPPYTISPQDEAQLDASVPFSLTPDQERTWQEIQEDLQKETAMDRLLVGDVGFGKTEIAMRTSYHVIKNDKQIALLAPTTLLAQQHYDTFTARFPKLKKNICLLSRTISPKEKKELHAKIEKGEIMLCIGTHALLTAKLKWKKLGLLIIDEEQRFGVKQKEFFKTLRAQIDILSMSATPIPRTLSMALSGLRELSLIQTPPKGRKSIITHVGKLTDELLTKAILKELSRDGQIYMVAPKIRQLRAIDEHARALVPHLKTAILHGQMDEVAIAKTMHAFDTGEIDALIASTIIENGLDLPRANTMIVWHAPHLGLSDLYQLRGRIGRRNAQGYAYFFYSQQEITSIQRERLTALTQASVLGAGWHIAQRDLEIRGAGNVLGAEQSGSVNTVGIKLYLDMVHSAIAGEEELEDTHIELPLSAHLPTHYISSNEERTRWYQRIARAHKESEFSAIISALIEKFGPMPEEANNTILLAQLQKIATKQKITSISFEHIKPSDEEPYMRLIIKGGNTLTLLQTLAPLGNFAVKQQHLTLDIDTINDKIIFELTELLKNNPTTNT